MANGCTIRPSVQAFHRGGTFPPPSLRHVVIMSYYTLHPRGSLRCVVSERAHPEISLGFAGRTSFSGAPARMDYPPPPPGPSVFSGVPSLGELGTKRSLVRPAARRPPKFTRKLVHGGSFPPPPSRRGGPARPRRDAPLATRRALRASGTRLRRAVLAQPRRGPTPRPRRATPAPNPKPRAPNHQRVFEPPPNPPARTYSALPSVGPRSSSSAPNLRPPTYSLPATHYSLLQQPR